MSPGVRRSRRAARPARRRAEARAGSPSKYMYAVTRATKGMVSAYTTPATIFSNASGASVRRISSAPRSGPAASATGSADPDEGSHLQPAASHSSRLRRKASTVRRPSTSTTCAARDRGREPDGDGKPDPCRAERDPGDGEEARRAEKRTGPRQREPVRLDRVDVAILVDLVERADGGGLDEREAEQHQRGADQRDTGASAPRPHRRRRQRTAGPGAQVITRTVGISNNPIPRNSSGRPMYIRLAEERTWPHARRRPTRSGATGVHVAFTAAKIKSAMRTASAIRTGSGIRRNLISPTEPAATASQKKSVAPVPRRRRSARRPPGRATPRTT